MCICADMDNQKPLNCTFIHTDSTFYPLNFRQTPVIIEISRTQLHTGTPPSRCRQKSCSHTDWTLHTQTRHYTHLLFCEVTHHRQERFVLFDRCRRSSLCVLTKDSQCPSCFAKRTSRSSVTSYKTEYSVRVTRLLCV